MSLNESLNPQERRYIFQSLGVVFPKSNSMQFHDLKNPAYKDTNGSLSINLRNGLCRDFGDESFSGDIVSFTQKFMSCNFAEAKEYIEKKLAREISNAERRYVPDKKEDAKPNFWNRSRKKEIKKCISRLKKGDTPKDVFDSIKRDGISFDTLMKYKCGYYSYHDMSFGESFKNHEYVFDFLAFPYATGVQLYKRENGKKVCRNIKGSNASGSMFGFSKNMEKSKVIFIMKSPREVMNFSQFNKTYPILGVLAGETIKEISEVSISQIESLIIKGDTDIMVCFDCNNTESYSNSLDFCNLLNSHFGDYCLIKLVNIYKHSKGLYKDYTDMVIESMERGVDVFSGFLDHEVVKPFLYAITEAETIK